MADMHVLNIGKNREYKCNCIFCRSCLYYAAFYQLRL